MGIVPVWHGLHLHDVCVKKQTAHDAFFFEGGDHNNIEQQAGDLFFDRLSHFLQHLEETPISDKLARQSEASLERLPPDAPRLSGSGHGTSLSEVSREASREIPREPRAPASAPNPARAPSGSSLTEAPDTTERRAPL